MRAFRDKVFEVELSWTFSGKEYTESGPSNLIPDKDDEEEVEVGTAVRLAPLSSVMHSTDRNASS